MTGSRHAAFGHAADCITLQADLLNIINILKNAYSMSWKSKKTNWKKKDQDVGLYMSRISKSICMLWTASSKLTNATELRHLSDK
jgi:hypothetical protein